MFATPATCDSGRLPVLILTFAVMVKTEINYSKGESLKLVSVDVAEVNKMNKLVNLEGTTKI